MYPSLYNYHSLASEIPINHPLKLKAKNYFDKLWQKPFSTRRLIFHHVDPLVRHLGLDRINSFIDGFSFPDSPSNDENQSLSKSD